MKIRCPSNKLNCVFLTLMLAACGGRDVDPSINGDPSSLSKDKGQPNIEKEKGEPDQAVADSDIGDPASDLTCSIKKQIKVANSTIYEVTQSDGVGTLFTAIDHGLLRLRGKDAKGNLIQIKFWFDAFYQLMPKDLGLGQSYTIDLAQAAKYLSPRVEMETYGSYKAPVWGENDAQFSGSISITPLSGLPGAYADFCVTVQPHIMSMYPYLVFHAEHVYLYAEFPCTYGQDQTCNDSSIVSAIYGTCDQDGFCTCTAPKTEKSISGKCAMKTADSF